MGEMNVVLLKEPSRVFPVLVSINISPLRGESQTAILEESVICEKEIGSRLS